MIISYFKKNDLDGILYSVEVLNQLEYNSFIQMHTDIEVYSVSTI